MSKVATLTRSREPKTKKIWEKTWENILTNKKWKDGRKDQSLQLWLETKNKKHTQKFEESFCMSERKLIE